MRIYGFKLKNFDTARNYISKVDAETLTAEEKKEFVIIDPEGIVSSACHLYTNSEGDQYIGFDVGLGLGVPQMKKLLKRLSNDLHIYLIK